MFTLYAEKNKLTLRGRETLTSGSVNIYDVRFTFSADWDGLSRIAVFRAGTSGEPTAVKVDENGGCVIPWEALTKNGVLLYAGVYGTGDAGEIVLPTVWAQSLRAQSSVKTPSRLRRIYGSRSLPGKPTGWITRRMANLAYMQERSCCLPSLSREAEEGAYPITGFFPTGRMKTSTLYRPSFTWKKRLTPFLLQ